MFTRGKTVRRNSVLSPICSRKILRSPKTAQFYSRLAIRQKRAKRSPHQRTYARKTGLSYGTISRPIRFTVILCVLIRTEVQNVYYGDDKCEWRRFLLEKCDRTFGEYTFEVCAFDESKNSSEWSNAVTISYEPTFETPTNLRLREDGKCVNWDEVDGAVRYYVRSTDENSTIRSYFYRSFTYFLLEELSKTGVYSLEIQAVDGDYNVSNWSEPISVSYTAPAPAPVLPEGPQNVRLDDSGDYILWDEVEGAASYHISWHRTIAYKGYNETLTSGLNAGTQPEYNWSAWAQRCPFPGTSYRFNVYVKDENNKRCSEDSKDLLIDDILPFDESIEMPENIWREGAYLHWDAVESTSWCWLSVLKNDRCFEYKGPTRTNSSNDLGKFPTGDYEAELFVVNQNYNYNTRSYSFTIDEADESIWIPRLYYKFETLVWDWDRLRHGNTNNFWLRISKDDTVVQFEKLTTNSFNKLSVLSNGKYTVEICATENGKTGKWSEPLNLTVHSGGLFDKEKEIEIPLPPIPTPEPDRITSITINPAFNMKNKHDTSAELDLTKIKVMAQEIYDEAGLKRAEEALGEEIIGNKHYNLLDLTLLYNDQDFSNGYDGLVQVIFPLPTGHRGKTFSCYRLIEVNGEMTKEVIPGEQTEDSYIIYLEHFSEYALIADGGELPHTHDFGTDRKSDGTNHWLECDCGEKSAVTAHIENSGVISAAPTMEATGVKTYSCTVCGYIIRTETVDKLEPDHTHTSSTEWKSDSVSHWHECSCGEKSELSAHTAGEWITESAAGTRHRDCTICGAVLETESLSDGNPSIGRPVTNPAVSTGTTNTGNTDNSTDPADPKDEDMEEPEPDETVEEGDVDADTDENDDDDEDEDDGYDDTFSKDDTDGNDVENDSPTVTPEAIARDENPGTGVPVNAAMIFGFLMAGAACAAFSKCRK